MKKKKKISENIDRDEKLTLKEEEEEEEEEEEADS